MSSLEFFSRHEGRHSTWSLRVAGVKYKEKSYEVFIFYYDLIK